MHNLFDQLAKKIGKGALDASGATVVQYEISRDAQHADLRHDPDPARGAERDRLGLLGKMAEDLCLIDIFGHAPDGHELRASLNKHLAHWEECARKAQAYNRRRRQGALPPEPLIEPRLWILAPAFSAPMLKKLGATAAPGWPVGVYLLGDSVLRAGVVVASALPRDRSTLLVRIMAAGPLLAGAVSDLLALPKDAPERTVAEDILVHLQHRIGNKPNRSLEEEEFIVKMQGNWAHAEELGRRAGRIEEAAQAVLTAFRVRGIAVPDDARERILAERNRRRLERWYERAIVAASAAEALDGRS